MALGRHFFPGLFDNVHGLVVLMFLGEIGKLVLQESQLLSPARQTTRSATMARHRLEHRAPAGCLLLPAWVTDLRQGAIRRERDRKRVSGSGAGTKFRRYDTGGKGDRSESRLQ